MIKAKKKKTKVIDPHIPIEDLIEKFPEIVDILVYDYELHCVGCVIAGYETLEEGATAHGIVGNEFEKMLSDINERINRKD